MAVWQWMTAILRDWTFCNIFLSTTGKSTWWFWKLTFLIGCYAVGMNRTVHSFPYSIYVRNAMCETISDKVNLLLKYLPLSQFSSQLYLALLHQPHSNCRQVDSNLLERDVWHTDIDASALTQASVPAHGSTHTQRHTHTHACTHTILSNFCCCQIAAGVAGRRFLSAVTLQWCLLRPLSVSVLRSP